MTQTSASPVSPPPFVRIQQWWNRPLAMLFANEVLQWRVIQQVGDPIDRLYTVHDHFDATLHGRGWKRVFNPLVWKVSHNEPIASLNPRHPFKHTEQEAKKHLGKFRNEHAGRTSDGRARLEQA